MDYADAIMRLNAIVSKCEGCPMPQDACECESTEECIIGAILQGPGPEENDE